MKIQRGTRTSTMASPRLLRQYRNLCCFLRAKTFEKQLIFIMYGDILFVLLLLIRVFVAIVAWPNAAVLSWTILTRTLKLIFWSDTPL